MYGLIFLVFMSFNLYSQTSNDTTSQFKHIISVQFNPAFRDLEELIWHGDQNKIKVFALRYGYKIRPDITIGAEFAGSNLRLFTHDTLIHNVNSLNFGAFSRYTINKYKIIKPFAEASLYYTCNRGWYESQYQAGRENIGDSFVGGYLAPGLSFSFLKNRINLDLMYKFSPRYFVNSKHKIISWRLSYNFNYKK